MKKLERHPDEIESEVEPPEQPVELPKSEPDRTSSPEPEPEPTPAAPTESEETTIWTKANQAIEEKSRDDDFEEFLDQLLL